MSTFLADITNRWNTNHPVKAVLGAATEGTVPPYVVFTFMAGGERRMAPSLTAWSTGVVTFTASAGTSVDAETLGDFAKSLFNMQSFGSVTDMVLSNRLLYYTDKPTLTGNRGWVSQIDFAIKY